MKKQINATVTGISLACLVLFFGCGGSSDGTDDGSKSFYNENGGTIHADLLSTGSVTANSRSITVKIYVDKTLNDANAKKAADALLSKFTGNGGNESIYGWVTNIYGSEWGTTGYSDLIADSKTISILLFDIDGDGSTGTNGAFTVGFFYSRDNFKQEASDDDLKYSNENIMFYIDLPFMLKTASSEGSWSTTGAYPNKVYSTLAHEFQHMIHFYQKTVLKSSSSVISDSTWLDEMCSVSTEDFVADKLGVEGPRGVLDVTSAGSEGNTSGSLPCFNYYNNDSLVTWDSKLYDYASVYAFGAYLSRNFGGPKLFQSIVQTSNTDMTAVTSAISSVAGSSESLESLLRQWGAAVLLSDSTSLTGNILYNVEKSQTVNSVTYTFGPINLYNYSYDYSSSSSLTHPYVYSSLESAYISDPRADSIDTELHNSIPGKAEITLKNMKLSKSLAAGSSSVKKIAELSSAAASSIAITYLSTWAVSAANPVDYLASSIKSLTVTPVSGGSTIYFIASNPNTSATGTVSITGGSLSATPRTVNAAANVYISTGTKITDATTYTISTSGSVVITAVAK